MKYIYEKIGIGLLTLSTLSVSCKSSGDKTSEGSQAMPVDVAEVTVDSVVIHKSYPGYLIADQRIDIVARVNGYIVGKYYADGKRVRKGTVLFSIEDSQYRDQLRQAEAQLATAIATNDYNTRHYTAMKKALETDAVSQMDVLQAESAVAQSEAAIKSARAAVASAKTMLGYCTIVAPIDGKVAAPAHSTGEYVAGAGAPVVLATVFNDDIVKAKFAIEDAQYMQVAHNKETGAIDYTKIPISFSDELNHSYVGSLGYEAPDVKTSTGTLDMDVAIPNTHDELKAGMYAVVNLPIASDPQAILVKDASIGTDQLGKYVYLVNDSNKVVYTSIETGELANDSMRIVTKGLKKGDRYVTRALLKVRSGMSVNPIMNK